MFRYVEDFVTVCHGYVDKLFLNTRVFRYLERKHKQSLEAMQLWQAQKCTLETGLATNSILRGRLGNLCHCHWPIEPGRTDGRRFYSRVSQNSQH